MPASDLTQYEDDQVVGFAEEIEGTMDAIFTKEFLEGMDKQFGFTPDVVDAMERLGGDVKALYAPRWSKLLKEPKHQQNLRIKASGILENLGISYVNPISFADARLEGVDWN